MIHPTPPGMLDGLSTPLKPWQESGAVGLVKLAQSEFKGGFLSDAMGVGKSLTALVAALELRKGLLPNCGFILIVCRAGCVQWAEEIRRHFKLDCHLAYILR
ncbi:uncharacterized protein FTOL_08139 [Fusarium torulosum]|uniref:SNF2 N-terminal domain-containing protein n=1 Tax=Fusarium torulosum TaxID=33205 RepID=A0AAE8SJN9_9HYPO|nr:uncharacterized protein FTOL_08139 [Fusarium torulosum]